MIRLTLLYFACSPMVARPLYDYMLFHPDHSDYSAMLSTPLKQLHDRLGVTVSELNFLAPDGKKLDAMYYKSPGATKVIIVSHCNAGNIQEQIIQTASLLCCNVNVFDYDYEGYGKSEGKPSIKAMINDGIAAFDFVTRNLHVNAENVVLLGISIGTGVTAQIAEHRHAAGVILQSGFSSLKAAGRDFFFFLPIYPGAWYDNMDSVAVMREPHAPLLVMHGDKDPILGLHLARDLYNGAIEPKRFVVLHDFGHCVERYNDQQYLNAIRSFLKSLK